jgi:hypothetical protein
MLLGSDEVCFSPSRAPSLPTRPAARVHCRRAAEPDRSQGHSDRHLPGSVSQKVFSALQFYIQVYMSNTLVCSKVLKKYSLQCPSRSVLAVLPLFEYTHSLKTYSLSCPCMSRRIHSKSTLCTAVICTSMYEYYSL